MPQCRSVRKRGSAEQCLTSALVGHTLCGRHARMKVPILWSSVNAGRTAYAIRIQSAVRGWLVRHRLELAGPGVLHRRDLANEEELMTCDIASEVHPFEYFSFTESGKVWWFSFDSLWRWCRQSHEPVNPYTKVPLSSDTRRRLREVWVRCIPNVPEESGTLEGRIRERWNILSQIFQDNGFTDVHPQSFLQFTKVDFISMFTLLHADLRIVLRESDPIRKKVIWLCARGHDYPNPGYSAHILMRILTLHKDPYPVVFSVLSALYRC